MNYFLYGAPKILPGEALSSWIHRLCQQQGFSTSDLFGVLGAKKPRDVDRELFSIWVSNLLQICRIAPHSFDVPIAVSKAVGKTRPLRQHLRITNNKAPWTAFCPQCLKQDAIPYFRIEWRFRFWELCPRHLIPLLTECPNCKSKLQLDKAILTSIEVLPTLAFCYFCHADFKSGGEDMSSIIDDELQVKVHTQRNMMASIVNGYCLVSPLQEKLSLHVMMRLYQTGLLMPANRLDFDRPCQPRQKEVFLHFVKTAQIKLRKQELLHERAARRKKTFKNNHVLQQNSNGEFIRLPNWAYKMR